MGPYQIFQVEGKEIYVDNDGRVEHYNIGQVIPEKTFTGKAMLEAVHEGVQRFRATCLKGDHCDEASDHLHEKAVRGNGGLEKKDVSSGEYEGPVTRSRSRSAPAIVITDVLNLRDPRCGVPGLAVA